MSLPAVNAVDPALQRMLAGELAKSLWATAKPADGADATGGTGDAGGTGSSSTAADTYSSLFTDVLADAIAGTPASARKGAR